MSDRSPSLQMKNITKRFPGVIALDSVDFECYAGEVHALAGENGAGKSTLMKVLSGVYQANEGDIILNSEIVKFTHPSQSLAKGIGVIYQEFSLLPDRSVAQNIFLGRELTLSFGRLDHQKMTEQTDKLLKRFGDNHQFNAQTLIADLDVAQQQMVEIAKALSLNAKVIVMDEPTAALNDTECEVLFSLIDNLRSDGHSIVYITHRMNEIQKLADRVSVIKDGKVTASFDYVPEPSKIIEAMVGREINQFYPPFAEDSDRGDILLSVKNGQNTKLSNINLALTAGEITGFAGVQGAGRNALAFALFGAEPFTSGELKVQGKQVNISSPRMAANHGIAMLPGDRKAQGLFLMQSVTDNGMISPRAFSPLWGSPSQTRFGSISDMSAAFNEFELRAANFDVDIQSLSGGNQQKAIVARWLSLAPKILIFIEPTRGIDINTKASIYEKMRELAKSGAAVMVISSDLPEVLGISDRVLVMSDGKIVAEFPKSALETDVMRAAAGLVEEVSP